MATQSKRVARLLAANADEMRHTPRSGGTDDPEPRPKLLQRCPGLNPAQDEWTEFGAYFCANPACALHVRVSDPNVQGRGNWAQHPDGHLVGRARYGGAMVCDDCGREFNAGRLELR